LDSGQTQFKIVITDKERQAVLGMGRKVPGQRYEHRCTGTVQRLL
jgi:hypothetical protein